MARNLDKRYRPMPVKSDGFTPEPIAQTCGWGVYGSKGSGRVSVDASKKPLNKGADLRRAGEIVIRTGRPGKVRSMATTKRWTTAAKNAQKRIHEDKRKVVDKVKGKTFYPQDNHTIAVNFCKGLRRELFMEITQRMIQGRVVPLDFHNLYNDLVRVLKFNVTAREWAKDRSKDEDRRRTILEGRDSGREGLRQKMKEGRVHVNFLLNDMREISGEKKVVAQGQL